MSHVTVRWRDASCELQTGGLEALEACRDGGWVWVDVTDADSETMSALQQRFDLHPLAVEDSLHRQRRAKLDIYTNFRFLTWLTPRRNGSGRLEITEMDIFLGSAFLVTLHDGANPAVDTIASRPERSMDGGPDWTLHAIIDLLVDSMLPIVDDVGDSLDSLEDAILASPDQEDLRRLHKLRRQLTRLRRIAAPERDILHGLIRESDVISDNAYRYFLDVGDHVAHVIDSIETYQDVAASVMDVYLSAQNNRMNQIMKQLTVVATIFMPLTLISGIYGMNTIAGMWPPAGFLREGGTAWAFWAIVASMIAIAVAMMAWFRRKNWW
ncbi:MAG: magnesium/cobalt transporter CorA [Coriobacteriales bacterium]|nr:magnesium/cobalt transporter CorA [Coriobacteriales bacterium]